MKTAFRFLIVAALWSLATTLAAVRADPTASAPSEQESSDDALRRLDQPSTTPSSDERIAPAHDDETTVEKEDQADAGEETPPAVEKKTRHGRHRGSASGENDDDQVSVFSNVVIGPSEVVRGAAVAVMGDLKIDGEVMSDAVAVMGDNTINGAVHGQAVAIMGNVTLGPKAHVMGDVVTVGGQVIRDPAAIVQGKIVQQGVGKNLRIGAPVSAWWSHGLSRGRPLAFGAHLAWLWTITVISIVLYAALAALFPRAVHRCGRMLIDKPGLTILTAFLSVLALPILFVLLLVTIVGIPVALIALPIGVVLAVLFGKAGFYALVGEKLTGDRLPLPLAVVIGAVIFVLLYLLPVVGLALSFLVSFLGFGCVVLALVTSGRKTPAAPSAAAVPPVVPPATPSPEAAADVASASFAAPAPEARAAVSEAVEAPSVTPLEREPLPESGLTPPPPIAAVPPMSAMPPPLVAATLPRIGFWLRTAALLIDLILVGVILAILDAQGSMIIVVLAAYGAVMWKLKGTTVGGIVCGIKVVRLDGRAIDWPTAIVRALGCFLSLVLAGLGFIWVAFDDEKQSWHDKIAGTTVVKMPKGTSLV